MARWKDVRNYGVLLIILVIGNSVIEIIPWFPHFAGLVTLLAGIFVYYKAGGDGIDFTFSGVATGSDSPSEIDLEVEPVEAPAELNKKVRDHPARRELMIDNTDRDNLDYYEEYREVTINGKEKGVWGVVGRPRDSSYSELIAYIYDLSENRIRRYKGNVQSIEGRIQPFHDHTWLSVRGVSAKRESSSGTGRNEIIIDQSSPGDQNKASEYGEGGS